MRPTIDDELNAAWAEVTKARAERDRAVETRENANAVSVRVEAENRLLTEELELAAEQGRLVGLEADRYRAAITAALRLLSEGEAESAEITLGYALTGETKSA